MSEPFDRAIERMLEDRSPLEEVEHLDPEEREMVRMAQMLRGSRGSEIRPEFVDNLHGRLFPQPARISRRTAFLGGLGTLAAGLAAGLGLDRVLRRDTSPDRSVAPGSANSMQIVGPDGHWAAVARVDEVPRGAVRPFKAGPIQGYLINDGVTLRAMSRICTHMGCVLDFDKGAQAMVCPCHGAQFSMQGGQIPLDYYPLRLAPLPPIKVRTRGEHVEVWTI